MRHLQIHELFRAVEGDSGSAVLQRHRFTWIEIDARVLDQPALVDQFFGEREQRLRQPGVQAGVAAVDVDRDSRFRHRGEARGQQFTAHQRSRGEQALDRDLISPAFLRIRIHAAGRVEPHGAAGQEGCRIVGLPLQSLGAGFAVRKRDGEGRRVAVPLQVDAIPLDPQRMVDL